ncbi:hypothetical protein DUNSADRAFT_9788 [Dunaliella salina]|uniref:Uncharacterized protein n=1 Tax=Dunaliella salina TaxID=3046 RepID=A0ABQ7GGN8_DUNSA|nr:hypothetical protein DUNSADRAFT_9788 [Dunaliella salina]|eukprot:KAF5833764.1 hypothetical protein DUNSADRAFT_9788 [Dunaliella salina]
MVNRFENSCFPNLAAIQGPVGQNLVNKAKKEEHCVMLRTGHRVPTHVYSSKGGDVPLPDGLLYYRCNLGPRGTVLMHHPRMPAPPPAINATPKGSAGSSGEAGGGDGSSAPAAGSATPAAVALPPLNVPCPEVEAVIDICQTLPPPNSGRPIGTEVLLKFKGYCADLHAWFPYENAKEILDSRTSLSSEGASRPLTPSLTARCPALPWTEHPCPRKYRTRSHRRTGKP